MLLYVRELGTLWPAVREGFLDMPPKQGTQQYVLGADFWP